MHSLLFSLIVLCFIILLLVPLLKRFHLPYLIAYLLAGIIIGPHVLAVFDESGPIEQVGELGVMLLMFFLGMEIDIPDKRSALLTPVAAQLVRTLLSGATAVVAGYILGWSAPSIILLIVLLSFNSTAVVSEFLKNHRELQTEHGKMVLNILLLQDIMLAPVLTIFQVLGGQSIDVLKLVSAAGASVLLFLLLRAIRNRNLFQLPIVRELEQDHDWQVFAAACICLGFGGLASLMGLTSAIGCFAAGLFIGRTKAFHWLGVVLHPFRVFFTALFFVSVGILLDLNYLRQNIWLIVCVTLLVMLINSLLSALVLRLFRLSWSKSLYTGALLSQTGEFGLLACSLAGQMGIISADVLKASIAITGLSLLLSTIWMEFVRRYIQPITT